MIAQLPPEHPGGKRRVGGLELPRPRAFWSGTLAVTVGVVLHIADFFRMRGALHDQPRREHLHYAMPGDLVHGGHPAMEMSWSPSMVLSMALIVAGVALTGYGLMPRRSGRSTTGRGGTARHELGLMDDAPLSRAHWTLLSVLAIALAVDVMKPATLGFVLPGLRAEYHLSIEQAAWLPLTALTGATVGSLVWGYLSDRIGRRASILLAASMFMATAVCGAMPTFESNLVMCLLMGASAGGMLPIVYALASESVPAKQRGWVMVLYAGLGVSGGYLAASAAAALLESTFGWRSLWFLGLPTGALIVILNRWIPESPRFLLERGRLDEARQVLTRYGVVLREVALESTPGVDPEGTREWHSLEASAGHGDRALFRAPHLSHTLLICGYGTAWGLVNWGFLTFLPTILGDIGVQAGWAATLLLYSALIAIPGTGIVAWLYGRSSKKSLICCAMCTAVALVAFAYLAPRATRGGHEIVLIVLVVLLLATASGMIAVLMPYAVEIFPTTLRGQGTGVAAASSKVAGIFAPQVMAWLLARPFGFGGAAFVIAVPLVILAIALAVHGVETTGRRLEDIHMALNAPPRRATRPRRLLTNPSREGIHGKDMDDMQDAAVGPTCDR